MSLNLQNMTKTQLEALIMEQAKQLEAKASGLVVKRNKAGGVYITHQSFRAMKKDGSGDYQAGLNISDETAKALFLTDIKDQIAELVRTLPQATQA